MGQIYNKEDDEAQAFHFHLESYRHYPVSLDVISWLGVWYVKSELYEKAIHFFERASQIQPDEVKWRLMVTSCYRRMHNYQKALELYEKIHTEHPDNLECLRYLVAICKDLGRPYDTYQQKLARLDRAPLAQTGRGALTRVGGDGDGRSGRSAGGALGRVQEDDNDGGRPKKGSPIHAPMARGDAGSAPKRVGKVDEEEDFADTDVGDLLPGM
jgi:intraflagellar transport protein 88